MRILPSLGAIIHFRSGLVAPTSPMHATIATRRLISTSESIGSNGAPAIRDASGREARFYASGDDERKTGLPHRDIQGRRANDLRFCLRR